MRQPKAAAWRSRARAIRWLAACAALIAAATLTAAALAQILTAQSGFSAEVLLNDTDSVVAPDSEAIVGLQITLESLANGETVATAIVQTVTVTGPAPITQVFIPAGSGSLPPTSPQLTPDADPSDPNAGLIEQDLTADEDTWADPSLAQLTIGELPEDLVEAESTITIVATIGVTDAEGRDRYTDVVARKVLTVGDAGEPVASILLQIAEDEASVVSVDQAIRLEYKIRNSLGALANDRDVGLVSFRASGAVLDPRTISDQARGQVSVRSSREQPRRVTISARVFSGSDRLESERLTLVFAGPARTITLGMPDGTLFNRRATDPDDPRGEIRIPLMAQDERRFPATPPTIRSRIIDPQGHRVTLITVTEVPLDERGEAFLILRTEAEPEQPLLSGTYTIEVSATRIAPVQARFAVGGPTASMTVWPQPFRPNQLGAKVIITAELLDSVGDFVADGTRVHFRSANENVLRVSSIGGGIVMSEDGVAKQTFIIYGRGAGVVIVRADEVVKVTVVYSEVPPGEVATPMHEPPPPRPPEIHGVRGLNRILFGPVVVWEAHNLTTVSRLLESLAPFGVHTVQLWNGRIWVRYAVADDEPLPGSNDFIIAPGDALMLIN